MIRIAGFEKESITDGTGVRYTIFVQGCKHECVGCHNTDTHSMDGGALFSIDKIVEEIKELEYLDGVTLSGGDPFFQPAESLKLLKKIKEETGKNIWAYTGYVFETLLRIRNKDIWDMLNYIDVIVDGPYVEKERDIGLRFRGSRNQRIINVRESLKIGTTILEKL
mgnify:CR=1 FL=1